MDAGRAYNDFPWMNGQWIPDDYWAVQGWRGFFENTAAVQLHHRLLATTTLVSVLTTWTLFRARPLPQASRQLLNGLAAVTCLQVSCTCCRASLCVMTDVNAHAWGPAYRLKALLPVVKHTCLHYWQCSTSWGPSSSELYVLHLTFRDAMSCITSGCCCCCENSLQ